MSLGALAAGVLRSIGGPGELCVPKRVVRHGCMASGQVGCWNCPEGVGLKLETAPGY